MKFWTLSLISTALLALTACGESSVFSYQRTNGQFAVIGGQEIDLTNTSANHVVYIEGRYPSGRPYVCTGTLIADDLVITAAHCIGDTGTMKIQFSPTPFEDLEEPVTVGVKQFKKKSNYNRLKDDHHDLAILQLNGDKPENYKPATLPWNAKGLQFPLKVATRFTTLGYGITSGEEKKSPIDTQGVGTLRMVKLEIMNYTKSADSFFVDQTKGRGVCSGDSGGPAFVNKDILIGTLSYGLGSDPNLCNFKSIYTNISNYQTWVEETIQEFQ